MNSPGRVYRLLLVPYMLVILLLAGSCSCTEDVTSLGKTSSGSNYESSTNDLSRRVDDGMTDMSRSRQKRNLLQLGSEIVRSTKFSPIKLAHYGNWCGRGGDRMGDGSYIDGCDLCCKKHDMCYRRTRLRFHDCNPREITYQSEYLKEDDRDICIDDGCAQDTCICDTKFVRCLKKEPCSPLKVYNSVSYFWWLGIGKET